MNEIIVCTNPQGSAEWFQDRAGAITGSMFIEIMQKLKSGPNKGGYRKSAESYAFQLAVERISGEPLQGEEFQTYAMKRGHELEPLARGLHEDIHGIKVDPCGFIKTEDGKFGISADGLVGDDDGCEYKCLVAPERLKGVLIDGDIEEFKPQCQGGMWLTGRKVWHLGFYCPMLAPIGKDLTVFEIERDDNYIEMMEEELVAFDRYVEELRAKLEDRDEAADAFG